ncbi:MAG: hypothetical protein JSW61_07035 [Candidatus Thorarchaeota archaeon]|nr:MAG: hypothetical protein JSW61_07035 [Candidatus Thorarchaeota archaeon]
MGLSEILQEITREIELDDEVREKVLPLARSAVRLCGESIKKSHRGQFDEARRLIQEAQNTIMDAEKELSRSRFLSQSRPLDTSYQELAEAANLLSILDNGSFTEPSKHDIPSRPYLTGLADTIGELRRATLDCLRSDNVRKAENLLSTMEEILEGLGAIDYPHALVPELRRKCDIGRGVVERTRGDVTTAVRQEKLVGELSKFERKKED